MAVICQADKSQIGALEVNCLVKMLIDQVKRENSNAKTLLYLEVAGLPHRVAEEVAERVEHKVKI